MNTIELLNDIFMHNFHSTLSIYSENGHKIVQLARKYNLLIACDDVYDLLYFPDSYPSAQPPRRLFTYDKLFVYTH